MAIIRTIQTPKISNAKLINEVWSQAPNDNGANQPRFLSADRRTVWGISWDGLVKSTDDGATWTPGAQRIKPSAEQLAGAWLLPNGEVIATSKVGGGKGGLHLSNGWNNGAGPMTWSKVLTVSQNDNKIHEYWGLSFAPKGHPREGLVVATEYGGQGSGSTPADGGARYVWVSLDYGKTWRTIFDLFAQTQVIGQHMHSVAYDPWDDRLICAFGDGNGANSSKSGIMACENFTATTPTWTYLYGPVTSADFQVTTIRPLSTGIIFGGDGAPPGIYRMGRNGYRNLKPMQTVLNYGGGTDTGYIGQDMFQAGPGQPILVSHEWAKNTNRHSAVHLTFNGVDFVEIWRDPNANAWTGLFVVGPTAAGKVLGWSKNDSRYTTSKAYFSADLVLD